MERGLEALANGTSQFAPDIEAVPGAPVEVFDSFDIQTGEHVMIWRVACRERTKHANRWGTTMGQIRERGGVYWIRFYRNGERLEESARTDKYETARELLKSREGDVADGRPVSVKAGRLRFEDAAADLETEYTVNGRKTLKHLQRRFTLHLTPWFGGRRLVDIDTGDVRAFTAARLKAEAAPGEINRELAALKRLFRLAKQAGRFVGDVPHVPMLQEHNIRRGFFERDQFDSVKGHLPAALRPVLEFAYLTGWRLTSEILPLEWRQVDWIGRVVRLDPGTTKNGEGRSFPLHGRDRIAPEGAAGAGTNAGTVTTIAVTPDNKRSA